MTAPPTGSDARDGGLAPPEPPIEGWKLDPFGRFEARRWDGTAWTSQVLHDGYLEDDPVPLADPARWLAEKAASRDGASTPSSGAPDRDAAPPPLPPPSVEASIDRPERWRSTLGPRTWLSWLFGLQATASLGMVAALANRLSVIDGVESGASSITDVQNADDSVMAAAAVIGVLFVVIAPLFVVWQWRCAKNAQALGRVQLRYTPTWSITGWLIPFANLVIPVRVMQDLWQSGDPVADARASSLPAWQSADTRVRWQSLRRSSLVSWWWALFVAGSLSARIAVPTGRGNVLDEDRLTDQITLVSALVSFGASLLAIFVVRSITRRQEAARAARTASPSHSSPRWAPPAGVSYHRRTRRGGRLVGIALGLALALTTVFVLAGGTIDVWFDIDGDNADLGSAVVITAALGADPTTATNTALVKDAGIAFEYPSDWTQLGKEDFAEGLQLGAGENPGTVEDGQIDYLTGILKFYAMLTASLGQSMRNRGNELGNNVAVIADEELRFWPNVAAFEEDFRQGIEGGDVLLGVSETTVGGKIAYRADRLMAARNLPGGRQVTIRQSVLCVSFRGGTTCVYVETTDDERGTAIIDSVLNSVRPI